MSIAANQLWQQVTGSVPDESARGLIIHFSLELEADESKSDSEGRPVFKEREYIEIRSPNDNLSTIHRPVEEKDKRMYPQLYRQWKEGAQDAISGTPLKEWAVIAKSQVEQLAFRGIRTVEQFVEVSDDGCHQLGHGFLTLRNKAQAWLAKAKDASEVTKLAALLTQKDNQIQSLQRQLTDIVSRMDARDRAEEAAPAKKSKA